MCVGMVAKQEVKRGKGLVGETERQLDNSVGVFFLETPVPIVCLLENVACLEIFTKNRFYEKRRHNKHNQTTQKIYILKIYTIRLKI